MATIPGIRPGVYEVDYFSSSQVGIFVGDILIDEITSLAFSVTQSRKPLYGYADTFFSAVSKGQVLVQGQFTINFKEAGYLWLVLRNNKEINGLMSPFGYRYDKTGERIDSDSFGPKETAFTRNIEQIVNGEADYANRIEAVRNLQEAYASLGGFASTARAAKDKKEDGSFTLGAAEDAFEAFENAVWKGSTEQLVNEDRRCDDPRLNPFDIYITYGDFTGDDTHNHTIVRLNDIHIFGTAQQIEMDNMPIQEMYQFFARTRI